MPLTRAIIEAKLAAGMTQAQIARQHRVSRQFVSKLLLAEPPKRGRGRPRKDAGMAACPHCEGTGRVKRDDALRLSNLEVENE